jgi:hypothetical protein
MTSQKSRHHNHVTLRKYQDFYGRVTHKIQFFLFKINLSISDKIVMGKGRSTSNTAQRRLTLKEQILRKI